MGLIGPGFRFPIQKGLSEARGFCIIIPESCRLNAVRKLRGFHLLFPRSFFFRARLFTNIKAFSSRPLIDPDGYDIFLLTLTMASNIVIF